MTECAQGGMDCVGPPAPQFIIHNSSFIILLVPGLTTFGVEYTPSNTYRFAWTDAAASRDTNTLVTASIELLRNGDVIVTTNGAVMRTARVLPFAHDGYGQDAEWVAATFTNATEIAAAGGYAAWVDAQVGEGLTNGLYKLTVGVTDDPPETTLVTVGDYSIAVTNAGAYVFLLEKGPDYDIAVLPPNTNVTLSAADDVPIGISPQINTNRHKLEEEDLCGFVQICGQESPSTRRWVADGGVFGTDYAPGCATGRVWWLPWLCGSPDLSHIGLADNPMTFTAGLTDWRGTNGVSFAWTASEGPTVASPNEQTTEISIDEMPSWAQASLSVTATIGNHTLTSYLDATYGTNTTPQVHIALNVPHVWVNTPTSTNNLRTASVRFSSDVPTNGTLTVSFEGNRNHLRTEQSNWTFYVYEGMESGWTWSLGALEGFEACSSVGEERFSWTFTPTDGEAVSGEKRTTVAEIHHITIAETPADRSRTTLGVGEQVMFYSEPDGLVTNAFCTAGSVTNLAEYGEVVFRAPSHAATVSVTVDCGGMLLPFSFDVIEPEDYTVDRVVPLYLNRPNEAGYILLFFMNRILPTDVSFYAVQVMEIPTVSTNAVGYYMQPAQADCLDHGKCGAGDWVSLEVDNSYSDKASVDALPPPWLDGGSYTWEIPFAWRVFDDANATNIFCHFNQTFELDADGTARIRKFGYCAERATNSVFTVVKENQP